MVRPLSPLELKEMSERLSSGTPRRTRQKPRTSKATAKRTGRSTAKRRK